MTIIGQSFPDTDVLIRHVDAHLALLRLGRSDGELALAERLAACLRELIVSTTGASAADRARVRAAIRYFVLRHDGRGNRQPIRLLSVAQRVINETALHLGRADLVVPADLPVAQPLKPAV